MLVDVALALLLSGCFCVIGYHMATYGRRGRRFGR
jgi:hypothetical protein